MKSTIRDMVAVPKKTKPIRKSVETRGRKPLDLNGVHILNVKFTKPVFEKLQEKSREKNIPLAAIVREATRTFLFD